MWPVGVGIVQWIYDNRCILQLCMDITAIANVVSFDGGPSVVESTRMNIKVAIRSLAGFENLPPVLVDALVKGVVLSQNDLVNAIKKNLSGTVLHARTGNLRNSFVAGPIMVSESGVEGSVGSNSEYAAIHEHGGEITPKNGTMLTIPLSAALTPSGVARFSARTLMTNPAPYRKTFIKHDIIFGVRARGDIEPLFALRTSVTLSARPYVEPAVAAVRDKVVGRMRKAAREAANQLKEAVL